MTLEVSHIYFAGWSALVIGLSLSTFGMFWSFMIIAYIMLFSVGFFCVLGYLGYVKSVERMRKASNTKLELPEQGLDRILKEVWESSRKSYKMDKRLTGSSIIDEPLQEVLQYFFRDYVHSWYCTISNDEEFLYDLRQTLQRALIAFANRSKDVEWVNFLTTRFVDDITNHLKIYRLAKERLDKLTEGDDTVHNIETLFFQVESEMEAGISRQKICLSEKSEKEYLCDISEMLLYLLLPPEDFHNKPFRYLFRELIATTVLLPTVKTMCDPDYINRTLVWLCKDSAFTREAFLTVISDGLFTTEDVQATKNKVNVEIVKLRAHDSETSDAADAAVRQQLSSLLFVQKLCDAKIKSIECGEGELPNVPMTSHEELPEPLLVPSQPIPILSLKVILDNNTALSYFIEFITSINSQVYLYFWLTVEGYRVTAEQQLSLRMEKHLQDEHMQKNSSSSPTRTWKVMAELANLRAAARSIFDQYLSDKANPRVQLSKDQLKKTQKRVMQEEPSADCFDEAQLMVYELLGQDQFYGAFLNSQAYMRCLLDLDILKEKSEDGDASASNDEDFETRSIAESISDLQEDPGHTDKLWTSDDDLRLTACIDQIGMCKDAGKSYAVYVISVFRATQDGTNSWSVYRRYSDFDDLHMRIKDKFGTIAELLLPGKRTFRNMDKDFLEKRRAALDGYIQAILSTTLLERYPGLFEIVANFLEIGKYAREKGQFARKVHNLRHSVHNVSHAIKTVPLGLSGGMQKMFTNKPGGSRDIKDDTDQIYADNDFEDDDNIALRVLLLLMDEIFDLKDRNLWLRRRIIVFLRQIIKTTYGDRINRKIVESVDDMTSSVQIAEYVKMFRDSFWPGGVLAEPCPERKTEVQLRTRVASKTKMFGSIPEELRRFLGADVTMNGVCRVFDTFQCASFNKRIVYVLAEGMLEQLFPENKFSDIFRKIHARVS